MDEIVKAALRKWPHVPACHDWLALDARGDWYMRDERVQAAGPFPAVKGSRIRHEKLLAFIHRNYLADAAGAWFFQNGPQRVYVALEAAPWVYGAEPPAEAGGTPRLLTHTGAPAGAVRDTWLDERGRLFIEAEAGFGLLRSPDMWVAAEAVEAGHWTPHELPFDDMPARFGYQLRPTAGSVTAALRA
jgi:hypothetical protein